MPAGFAVLSGRGAVSNGHSPPLLCVLCFVLVFALLSGGVTRARAMSLFEAPEKAAEMFSEYRQNYAPRWQRILEAEKAWPTFNAEGCGMNPADAAQWRVLVRQARGASEAKILRMVNGFFNHWLFQSDMAAWGVPDYWTTPAEFVRNRGGDCEDYAIAKYFALRYLGFPAERLRVTLIRQVNGKGVPYPQMHAVLAVKTSKTWFILDNNARPKLSISPYPQYRGRFIPLYSLNELGAWKHRDDPLYRREADSPQ